MRQYRARARQKETHVSRREFIGARPPYCSRRAALSGCGEGPIRIGAVLRSGGLELSATRRIGIDLAADQRRRRHPRQQGRGPVPDKIDPKTSVERTTS
jgi:hypothetical protein